MVLCILAVDGALRTVALHDGQVSLGTHADVQLRYPTVSRQHASVCVRGGTVYYTDLGSRNGSFLADARLEPNTEVAWARKTTIRVGPFRLYWEPGLGDADHERLRRAYLDLAAQTAGLEHDFSARLEGRGFSADEIEVLKQECFADGPLREILQNPQCKDLLINDWDQVFADVGEGLRPTGLQFLCAESYLAWGRRKALECHRRLDVQHPICEASLPGGARFHAVLAPVSKRGLSVSIRRFGSAPVDEAHALQSGWMDEAVLGLLREAVQNKLNLVISGGTSSGKTSLLNFLCQYFAKDERVLTVEDTPELSPPILNWVQLVSRPQNTEGKGEVSLRQLIQSALRMRPDRILVGECRGAEVLDMLQALNTGHPGSLTTVHANSAEQALERLELMTLLGGTAGLSPQVAQRWICSSIQMIAQVDRLESGQRVVREVAFLEKGRAKIVYRRAI